MCSASAGPVYVCVQTEKWVFRRRNRRRARQCDILRSSVFREIDPEIVNGTDSLANDAIRYEMLF